MNKKTIPSNLESESKWIDNLLELVNQKLFDWNAEDSEEFRVLKYNIWIAYDLMKKEFDGDFRATWERYFEHLRAVTNIVLTFIDNPNKEKVLIALLHDFIEDKDFPFESLVDLFWSKVIIAVLWLSKKKLENYEIDGWDNSKEELKKRRNEDYFSHMESFDSMLRYVKELVKEKNITDLSEQDLIEITKNIIDVKLADRIHNIWTQWDKNNREKVKSKIEETEKYFYNIAKQRDVRIYNELHKSVLDLKVKLTGVEYDVNLLLEDKN